MAHGAPLMVRLVTADDQQQQYWYFESRLERELVYRAIKGSQPAPAYLTNYESAWTSLAERLWLIWRTQPWFQQRIGARLQAILNKVTKPSFLVCNCLYLSYVH